MDFEQRVLQAMNSIVTKMSSLMQAQLDSLKVDLQAIGEACMNEIKSLKKDEEAK